MGWTYRHVNSPVRRAEECRSEISDKYEILKDALIGSTWYAALRHKETGKVHAAIVLTEVDNGDHYNFGVKFMDENMCPFYYDCPESILSLLSPTTEEYALEWRKKCHEIATAKKLLGKAPYESRFEVTLENGSTRIVIKKRPNYQFKTWWLLVENENTYIPKRKITAAIQLQA